MRVCVWLLASRCVCLGLRLTSEVADCAGSHDVAIIHHCVLLSQTPVTPYTIFGWGFFLTQQLW